MGLGRYFGWQRCVRRAVRRRHIAFLLVGVMALTACATTSPAPDDDGGPTEAGAEITTDPAAVSTPPAEPTGVLRVAIRREQPLDPSLHPDGGDGYLQHGIYETLTKYNKDGTEPVGELAERWESSDDAREWTFHLREDITFHDGEPLTSSAVKASFEYWAREGSVWGFVLPGDIQYDDSDPQILRVTTTEPSPDMARNATQIAVVSPDLLERGAEAVATEPVGTGPYRFVSHTSSQGVTLEANPDYWGDGPYVERVEFKLIPDATARANALRAGDVDIVTKMAPAEAEPLRDINGLVVTETPVWSQNQLIMFTKSSPLDNLKLRQAVAHAIDKQSLIDAILLGVGQPADSYVAPGVYGYASPNTQYPYDPDRARELIAESGLSTPIEIDLVWAPELGTNQDRITAAIAGMLAEVGIDATVTQEPIAQIAEELVAEEKHNHGVTGDLGWLTGGPMFLAIRYWETRTNLDDGEFLRLRDEALATPDGPERLELMAEIQEQMAQLVPAVPLYVIHQIDAYASSVQGYTTSHDGFVPDFGTVYLGDE